MTVLHASVMAIDERRSLKALRDVWLVAGADRRAVVEGVLTFFRCRLQRSQELSIERGMKCSAGLHRQRQKRTAPPLVRSAQQVRWGAES